MWGALDTLFNNAKALDLHRGFFVVFSDGDNAEWISILNTENQLWEGVNAKDVNLERIGGYYSPLTVKLKSLQGLPVDRVTLFDTGEFYDSFGEKISRSGFTITADTIKDGEDLRERWGGDLLGLTPDSVQELLDQVKDDLLKWLINDLMQGI